MPSIPLHPPPSAAAPTAPPSHAQPTNPLPPLLHTPTGLALLELQGTIHFPTTPSTASAPTSSTLVGKLAFPLYNPTVNGEGDERWMKRVYFYVGRGQRMSGEVRKLGRPFAVVRRREEREGDVVMGGVDGEERGRGEELEIVEIVKYKVVFSARPEPGWGVVGRLENRLRSKKERLHMDP
ncbi:hypothetical protein CC80DRAFT_99085 [Byssothecium circinans]|uniref:Chromosome transmission fidelity protein 8 n=1 Tax=Byssothecium circinans TaxID=147558 RepID=A0A6A5UGG9_9PLEO|nr:hypothetical protein CC80DRAFT_99085 [Byssothecium circinans]